MIRHRADVAWALQDGEDFLKGRYSRAHRVVFDAPLTVPGSPSPHVVPAPWSTEAAVDPEEMLVAAIAACHMLSFLQAARDQKIVVTAYSDAAEGTMEKNGEGRWWVSRVVLRPLIAFAEGELSAEQLDALHHAAHEMCFIANSVKTEVVVEGPLSP
jgi:organic hydroperoxide reductase OsmC/OhrA